jgi:hypothetical protein
LILFITYSIKSEEKEEIDQTSEIELVKPSKIEIKWVLFLIFGSI